MKRLVLELGGHAPFLVFADADLDRAVAEAIKAKFATSGQDCLGANRFLIERPIYADFCRRFAEAAAALTAGPGDDRPRHRPADERTRRRQAGGAGRRRAGQRRAPPDRRHSASTSGRTSTPRPSLPTSPPTRAIIHEETFGPVAALAAFDTEAEAVDRANATEYGLVAYLHTLDPRRIYRMTRALQFGMVAVNRTKVTGAPIPFGGFKQSGLGREGARLGMEAFMEVKYVCRDWG